MTATVPDDLDLSTVDQGVYVLVTSGGSRLTLDFDKWTYRRNPARGRREQTDDGRELPMRQHYPIEEGCRVGGQMVLHLADIVLHGMTLEPWRSSSTIRQIVRIR